MRLKQLEYTLEVAKCKSYSKAAKKLFTSQPALSNAIAALEDELNITIFHRTPKGIFLTDDGENVITQIELILSNVDNLANYSQIHTLKHTVTLAAIPTACNSITIELMKQLSETNSNITINLLEMRPQKIISALNNGLADIAIGSYTADTEQQIKHDATKNNLHIEPLLEDELYVFLPRNHSKCRQSSITLEELKEDHQAVFNDFLLLDCNCNTIPDEEEIPLSECYTFSDRSSIKQAVAAGLAYSILPFQMILDDIYYTSGLIKAVPIADNNAPITTYLAWHKSNYTPIHETIVLDNIRALYHDASIRLQAKKPKQLQHITFSNYGKLRY